MTTRIAYQTHKLHAMINRVTFKVIGRNDCSDGHISLNAQCFVNKVRVVIPLSVYIEAKYFDGNKELVKMQHPQSISYNSIIFNARDRVAHILADANSQNIRLDRDTFRARFTTTLSDVDFVKFWETELIARKGTIEVTTWKQQYYSLQKFKQFRDVVPFDTVNIALLEDYERFLIRKGNGLGTIGAAMKNVKVYINYALKRDIQIKNPFVHYKIRKTQGRIIYLTIPEVQVMLRLYDQATLEPQLQESLLVFLVQSFCSLRISDVKNIQPHWIIEGEMDFTPYKTRKFRKAVRFGLSKIALRLLADFFELKKIKTIKSEQKINDDLKLIALHASIRKRLSTHVGRHTFATTFIALGGDVVVLKDIMGHTRIETTMLYVHVVDTRKTEQMGNFDNEFK